MGRDTFHYTKVLKAPSNLAPSCQGGGSHSFSGQPVPGPHHPHRKEGSLHGAHGSGGTTSSLADAGRFCGFPGRNGNRFGWNCWAGWSDGGKGSETGEWGWQEDRLSPAVMGGGGYIDPFQTKLRGIACPLAFGRGVQRCNKAEKNAETVL